ncbi:MAG: hypothetical protein ACK55I_01610, partial [bacterium]
YKLDYKIRIAKWINIWLMSFYVLYNVPLLASLLIHWYTELFTIAFSNFLYNNFDVEIKSKKVSKNVPTLKTISEEFATKDEVEAMLTNKKFD